MIGQSLSKIFFESSSLILLIYKNLNKDLIYKICGVSLPYRSVEEIYLEFSIYRNHAYCCHATYKSPDVNKSQLTPALNSPRLSF